MEKKKIPKPNLKNGVEDCMVREFTRCYRKGYNQAIEDCEKEKKYD